MSVHGWIALGLGITLSFAVWGVLVYLSHYSAKHGYDDIDRPDE